MDHDNTYYLITHTPAVLVAVVAIARATRLLVFDDWPPGVRFREWFLVKFGDRWGSLILCPFCTAPYLAAADLAWYVAGMEWSDPVLYAWWVVNLWAALSYLAAILVAYDQPEE